MNFQLLKILTFSILILTSKPSSSFTIVVSDTSNNTLLPNPHHSLATTDPVEQSAVYEIMRATGNNWAVDIPDVCRGRWHGIECMPDRDNIFHVVSLSFGALSDDTAFPTCDQPKSTISPAITKLPHLRTLFFYRCLIANPQPIPRFLGKLGKSLQTLVLRENGHVGRIPDELGNLTGLTVLDLHGNYLNGSIPDSLNRIAKLKSLDLSSNRLSGPIPKISFPELRVLDLNQNHLSGPIPDPLLTSSNLMKVDLSRNRLSGPISFSSVNALESLILLDLSYNTFTGPFPETLQGLKSLQALILSGNRMASTSIPEGAFRGLTCLTILGLSDMGLEGVIPESLGELTGLRVVHLDRNMLNGTIPESLGRLKGVSEMNLENNRLIGSVPFTRERVWRMGRKLRLGNNLGLCYDEKSGVGDDVETDGIGQCGMGKNFGHEHDEGWLGQLQHTMLSRKQEHSVGTSSRIGFSEVFVLVWFCSLLNGLF